MFFGRDSEFTLVQKRFHDARRGSLMVFCGERRSGKTSILLQILQGRLGSDFVAVLVDMQAMAVGAEVEFLSTIASGIAEQLGTTQQTVPDFESASKPSAAFRKFVESTLAQHEERRLVLLFDEYELFEDMIDAGSLTSDILLVLANLMENNPLFLVFTGSQHLEERRVEYWRILEKAHEYRRISYLQQADAVKLIERPVEGRVHYSAEIIQRILRLTAGHPFYTQAICQNLIDTLNEQVTNVVDQEMVDAVVERIVEYPLPQTTFQWETLERNEKLTLALLADALEDEDSFASAENLVRTLDRGKYPLQLNRSSIATALEALFKQELLSKNDDRTPGYGFRMDLWRQWVHRMHSVWQVMHEEGLEFRGKRRRWRRVALVAVAVAVLGAAGAWIAWQPDAPPTGARLEPGGTPNDLIGVPTGYVNLVCEPEAATIALNGRSIAIGRYQSSIAAGHDHAFTLSASGYVDSTLAFQLAEAESATIHVSLRPHHGGVYIETVPEDARIDLDGVEVGRGTVTRQDLAVPEAHSVTVRLDGFRPHQESFRVHPDSTLELAIQLDPLTVDFSVLTSPAGANILMDGARSGSAPLVVPDLSYGSHRFEARLAGYVAVDTTLVVDGTVKHVRLNLSPEPPGILLVRGDRPATIYIDEQRIGSGELPSSGETPVEAGTHTVEVLFRDGTTDRMTITIRPAERILLQWEGKKLRRAQDTN
jgi:hypothetical protein